MEVGVMVAVGAVVAMAVVMEVVGVDLEAVVGMGAGMVVVDLEMEVDWEVADWEAAAAAAVACDDDNKDSRRRRCTAGNVHQEILCGGVGHLRGRKRGRGRYTRRRRHEHRGSNGSLVEGGGFCGKVDCGFFGGGGVSLQFNSCGFCGDGVRLIGSGDGSGSDSSGGFRLESRQHGAINARNGG
mmetsp:Transcript_11450/g.18399  ORF Transcript_11450/g.18399 Transcript_11450/m.18399 type:complete len:184 (-) Transcript_11450:398-949(-)